MKNIKKALGGLLYRKVMLRGQLPPGFDSAAYLELNPDVRAAGGDPGLHYLRYGREEGRPFQMPRLTPLKEGRPAGSRPVVLVVCHEASRSGAPVLGLNLVRELQVTHDVVVLLLGKGPLVPDFTAAATAAFLCPELRLTPSDEAATRVVQELCKRFAFAGAIINSVECRAALHGLSACGVPAVSLLHEFAAYTRPASAFPRALFWSQKAVFSARITRDDAFRRLELRDAANLALLPQGKCTVGVARDAKEAVPAPVLRGPREATARPAIHILGVGAVQYRKGVDLFIECARRMRVLDPETDYRFHWVGGGYKPGSDLQYSAYLADQIQRAGLPDRVRILGETDQLEDVYKQADLFLLTSRLDPLPNVAIDAATGGLPVLCFAETTGIADFLRQAGLDELVADYLDSSDLAAKAVALARSRERRQAVSATLKARAAEIFSMASYVATLRGLLDAGATRLRQERQDALELREAGVLRTDVCVHPAHAQLGDGLAADAKTVADTYVRAWASGLYRRKPFPGFHPAIYAERTGLRGEADPLAHWLRAGRPDGPWNAPVLTPAAEPAGKDWLRQRRVALHVHAYYPELLGELVQRLASNTVRPHLFVTVTDEVQRDAAAAALRAFPGPVEAIQVVPNRGRDIGPFLSACAGGALDGYELVGHLHTKKSVDVEDANLGASWYRFLLANLVGGREGGGMLDRIATRMLAGDGPGMVFPEDPYAFDDEGNAAGVAALAQRGGWPQPPVHHRFPVGSMFWARPEALRPMLALHLAVEDYPCEPLPYDGTILHALERALGLAGAAVPGGVAVTNIQGVTR